MDFLTHLIAKNTRPMEEIRPRGFSLYEPQRARSGGGFQRDQALSAGKETGLQEEEGVQSVVRSPTSMLASETAGRLDVIQPTHLDQSWLRDRNGVQSTAPSDVPENEPRRLRMAPREQDFAFEDRSLQSSHREGVLLADPVERYTVPPQPAMAISNKNEPERPQLTPEFKMAPTVQPGIKERFFASRAEDDVTQRMSLFSQASQGTITPRVVAPLVMPRNQGSDNASSTISVTIGKIEIRATEKSESTPTRQRESRRIMPLDEYLARQGKA